MVEQIESLEHYADGAGSQASTAAFAQEVEDLPIEQDLAFVRSLQPGNNMQKRGFAGPRPTGQADQLAAGYLQVNTPEDLTGLPLPTKGAVNATQTNQWVGSHGDIMREQGEIVDTGYWK